MLPTTFFTNSKDIFEILQLREFNLIKRGDDIFHYDIYGYITLLT